MNFYSIGSLQQYGKQLEAKSLWEKRKQNGFYRDLSEKDPALASVQEQADQMHSKKQQAAQEVAALYEKVQRGESLTQAEMDQLRQENPELYEKVKGLEAEQKAYEKELRNCKTKGDVERLKMEKINASMNVIQTTFNNPNIGDSKKLEIAKQENSRMAAINESTQRFIESGEYAALPSDAEKNQAIQEENQARQEELAGEEGKTPETEELQEPEEKPEEPILSPSNQEPQVQKLLGLPQSPAEKDGAPEMQFPGTGAEPAQEAVARSGPKEEGGASSPTAGRAAAHARKAVAAYRRAAAFEQQDRESARRFREQEDGE